MQYAKGRLGAGMVGVALIAAVVLGACADKKGALMLAVSTDMKAPKDVNAVSVTISTNGAIKHSFIGRVTPQGDVLLPATLAIVEPDDKSATIRIRVIAFQERKPRVLRDVRTTVPSGGRTALLRIPLSFANDGSTKSAPLPDGVLPPPRFGSASGGSSGSGTSGGGSSGAGTDGGSAGIPSSGDFDFFGSFQPDCPDVENQTFIDGACVDNFVDSAALPDFDTALVGDSTDKGSCFDVPKCFSAALKIGEGPTDPGPQDAGVSDASRDAAPATMDGGTKDGGAFKDFRPSAVTLDRASCALSLNGANPARLNLAIVTPDTGECVRPGECYIPIDRGPTGWKEENGRVQLPLFVCRLLSSKNLRLATSTETCTAKEESNPICMEKAPDVAAIAGDCATFGRVYCAKVRECEVDFLTLYEAVDCEKYLAEYCDATRKAPGTPPLTSECNASIAAASCEGFFLDSNLGLECYLRGNLPDAAACQFDSQCKSGDCSNNSESTGTCGTCRARLAMNAPCGGADRSGNCDFGLDCSGSPGSCAKPSTAHLGDDCSGQARRCELHLVCVSGKCAAPLPAGAPCRGDGTLGSCDENGGYSCLPYSTANGTCQKRTYTATAGAACGSATGDLVECGRDLSCEGTGTNQTCQPRPGPGQPCVDTRCAGTAQCINKVCAALDPFRCSAL